MRHFLVALIYFFPVVCHANLLLQYGINQSSQKDSSEDGSFKTSRTFHKGFLAGSINGARTLFLGWNINSWSSTGKEWMNPEQSNSLLEMGPRLQWFINEGYNLYVSTEWNPYAKGEREKIGLKRKISGSSYGFGIGYRFNLSKVIGLGAALHYHSLTIREDKVNSIEMNVSDKITNLMPMLELTILTR